MKTALVCGAGGFIGGHLTKMLKAEGFWVRGVDIQKHCWNESATDDFQFLDLRSYGNAIEALRLHGSGFDEVYQLAADMGGMGFIALHDVECLTNNCRINMNMLDAAAHAGIGRYFYSSSVCVYPDMASDSEWIDEDGAYPAHPDNEYGWEKLYSERLALAYAARYKLQVRIARFQNCFGPNCAWNDGREKAPAALCRKVALASDGDAIEVWGDGTVERNFIYIDDLLSGFTALMRSDESRPTNIGTDEIVTVDELAQLVIAISGKRIGIKHVDGIVGVQARNFSNARINALGWKPQHSLGHGLVRLYNWIATQVAKSYSCDCGGGCCR